MAFVVGWQCRCARTRLGWGFFVSGSDRGQVEEQGFESVKVKGREEPAPPAGVSAPSGNRAAVHRAVELGGAAGGWWGGWRSVPHGRVVSPMGTVPNPGSKVR